MVAHFDPDVDANVYRDAQAEQHAATHPDACSAHVNAKCFRVYPAFW